MVDGAVGGETGGGEIAAGLVIIGDGLEARVAGLLGLVGQRHHRIGQVGEKRLQTFVKQRQPMLHAGVPAFGADRLIEGVLLGHGAEEIPVVLAETGDGHLVQQNLAHRLELEGLEVAFASLSQRVEAADALHYVAEQIETHRPIQPRREDVDQATANGIFSRFHHRLGPAVAVLDEEIGQRLKLDGLALRRRKAGVAVGLGRRHALQEGVDGGKGDPADACSRAPARQARQRIDALGCDRAFGRYPVIGQTIPCRHLQHLGLGREEVKRLGDARHGRVVDGDMQDVGKRGGCGKLAQHQGIAARRRARDLDASGRGEDIS